MNTTPSSDDLDPVARFLVWLESQGYKIINPTQRPAHIVLRGNIATSEEIMEKYIGR